jgi:glycosyltransferase involved in cell wall biosynthesis
VIENTESVAELTAALQAVLEHPELLPARREAARKCAMPLTWGNIGAAYLQHYADVAG